MASKLKKKKKRNLIAEAESHYQSLMRLTNVIIKQGDQSNLQASSAVQQALQSSAPIEAQNTSEVNGKPPVKSWLANALPWLANTYNKIKNAALSFIGLQPPQENTVTAPEPAVTSIPDYPNINNDIEESNRKIAALRNRYDYLAQLTAADIAKALKDKNSAIRKDINNQRWFNALLTDIREEQIILFIERQILAKKMELLTQLLAEEKNSANLQLLLEDHENSRNPNPDSEQRIDDLNTAIKQSGELQARLDAIHDRYQKLNEERTRQYGKDLREAFIEYQNSLTSEADIQKSKEIVSNYDEAEEMHQRLDAKKETVLGQINHPALQNSKQVDFQSLMLSELIKAAAAREHRIQLGEDKKIDDASKNYKRDIKQNLKWQGVEVQDVAEAVKSEIDTKVVPTDDKVKVVEAAITKKLSASSVDSVAAKTEAEANRDIDYASSIPEQVNEQAELEKDASVNSEIAEINEAEAEQEIDFDNILDDMLASEQEEAVHSDLKDNLPVNQFESNNNTPIIIKANDTLSKRDQDRDLDRANNNDDLLISKESPDVEANSATRK